MAGAIEAVRSSVTGTEPDYQLLLTSGLTAFFAFIVGLIYFRRTEYYFADLA